ncbi:hypothetical protein BPAE_0201g00190 [Botrytis paeoniae]|uniref:Uncharacterized protein n=1 Tax=Botrytis paeoniae TaxID=278948 RepID=A0A4Z1FJQ8_9HELO|nr:hypothetical protein BPAE_0201g00190 [Botrytis paeoniae]
MPHLEVTQNALQNKESREEKSTSGYIQPDPLHIMIVGEYSWGNTYLTGQSTGIFYIKIALGA